jgi:hypothetical protein
MSLPFIVCVIWLKMRKLIVIGLLLLGSEIYGQKAGHSINIDSLSTFQNHYLNGISITG